MKKDWMQLGLAMAVTVLLVAVAGLFFRLRAVEQALAMVSQQWELHQHHQTNPVGLQKGSQAPPFKVENSNRAEPGAKTFFRWQGTVGFHRPELRSL